MWTPGSLHWRSAGKERATGSSDSIPPEAPGTEAEAWRAGFSRYILFPEVCCICRWPIHQRWRDEVKYRTIHSCWNIDGKYHHRYLRSAGRSPHFLQAQRQSFSSLRQSPGCIRIRGKSAGRECDGDEDAECSNLYRSFPCTRQKNMTVWRRKRLEIMDSCRRKYV